MTTIVAIDAEKQKAKNQSTALMLRIRLIDRIITEAVLAVIREILHRRDRADGNRRAARQQEEENDYDGRGLSAEINGHFCRQTNMTTQSARK